MIQPNADKKPTATVAVSSQNAVTAATTHKDAHLKTAPSKTASHLANRQTTLNFDKAELILPPDGCCFHCGDPVPTPPFTADILGESRLMCCLGCQLAAQSIVAAGLEQYYLDRSQINRTASLPTELERLQAYDHEDIKAQFVYSDKDKSVAELSVNNLRCAACTWLIETRLYELDGVETCQVNLTSQRMRVVWDESKLPISQILKTINDIGYAAKPYRQDTHEAMLARANKKMLIRLGIAALGAMQAMMYAVGMYFGDYSGMDIAQRTFLRWVSLFVSIPVFFYCAVPFFTSAWSAIKAPQVNMDVPVSIALIVTFFASLYATLTGIGETYYDSVSMFVFFLLAGRYIEHNARLKAANMANDLVVVEPTLVQKIAHVPDLVTAIMASETDALAPNPAVETTTATVDETSLSQLKSLGDQIHHARQNRTHADKTSQSTVTANALQVGDVIIIEAGSDVVADGVLCSERATVSQSLLTGEGDLIVKARGDTVIGGSQNDSQPFVMLVTALPENSQIALIDRLMNRAMSEKPKIAEQADRWARWFVARILVLSVVVFIGWYLVDPSQAIWATVAVLVATCPCALSLATPIALTVSTNRLASYGFLTTRGHTIQTLAEITHVAFDKTGTLTYGKPNLLFIEDLSAISTQAIDNRVSPSKDPQQYPKSNKDDLLAIAAALEVGSRHPIATALLDAAYQQHLPAVRNLIHHPAGGIEGVVHSHHEQHRHRNSDDNGDEAVYRLGHVDFALGHDTLEAKPITAGQTYQPDLAVHHASTAVMLTQLVDNTDSRASQTQTWQPLAMFYFNDSIRDGMGEMIAQLQAQNIKTLMLTGDPSDHAHSVAHELGIDQMANGLSPSDKVAHIKRLQADGNIVMMVGDGINDAPVLAAANVSTAIAGAADLAQVSSDSVILNGAVTAIYDAKRLADKAQQIIKQNLYWALGYNAVVLLPAAFGYVPPWLAAIGMSLSSLLVVLNALRLKRA